MLMRLYFHDGEGRADPTRNFGGDKQTGVSIMHMNEGLDTGNILMQPFMILTIMKHLPLCTINYLYLPLKHFMMQLKILSA